MSSGIAVWHSSDNTDDNNHNSNSLNMILFSKLRSISFLTKWPELCVGAKGWNFTDDNSFTNQSSIALTIFHMGALTGECKDALSELWVIGGLFWMELYNNQPMVTWR